MKSTGKAACILPHGVLFRGNAEAVIRKQLDPLAASSRASSACPPTCSTAPASRPASWCWTRRTPPPRKGIFMIDASKGYIKDGTKNRLREQDIHRIVDTFTKQAERAALRPPGAAGRNRRPEERLQPQPAALHRQQRARRPAGHRRPPARRHPGARPDDCRPMARTGRCCPACAAASFESAGRPGYARAEAAAGRGQARHPRPRRVRGLQPGGHRALRRLARGGHAAPARPSARATTPRR